MLHTQDVIVRRNGKRIIDSLNLSVIGGELVAVMGAAASGKSMLMGVLSGDVRPSAGHVWLAGKPLGAWGRQQLAVRRAVLPQVVDVACALTVWDVVRLGRAPHNGVTQSAQDLEIGEAALRWAKVEHLRDHPYPNLSRDDQQMVQLARILTQTWGRAPYGDCYVLMDEPTACVDIRHQHQTMAIAKQLAGEGAAVLVALNDINLAAQYCDRLVFLKAGRLHAEGPPEQLMEARLLADVFGIEALVLKHPTQTYSYIVAA